MISSSTKSWKWSEVTCWRWRVLLWEFFYLDFRLRAVSTSVHWFNSNAMTSVISNSRHMNNSIECNRRSTISFTSLFALVFSTFVCICRFLRDDITLLCESLFRSFFSQLLICQKRIFSSLKTYIESLISLARRKKNSISYRTSASHICRHFVLKHVSSSQHGLLCHSHLLR